MVFMERREMSPADGISGRRWVRSGVFADSVVSVAVREKISLSVLPSPKW